MNPELRVTELADGHSKQTQSRMWEHAHCILLPPLGSSQLGYPKMEERKNILNSRSDLGPGLTL